MVRFIIETNVYKARNHLRIYIPIWLDLLSIFYLVLDSILRNLHSNMVRFIILSSHSAFAMPDIFTFQYGQIYYFRCNDIHYISSEIYIPIWLDLLLILLCLVRHKLCYLHSNMVRFIISIEEQYEAFKRAFTFQYGQIYYTIRTNGGTRTRRIYIPIWLDLLCI